MGLQNLLRRFESVRDLLTAEAALFSYGKQSLDGVVSLYDPLFLCLGEGWNGN